jgi:hypothetical protein
MANPMYGSNKYDGRPGWLDNNEGVFDHGTLAGGLTLTVGVIMDYVASKADPAGARAITVPTAALTVAGIKARSSDGKCKVGDTFQFSFINVGTAGEDETCTMTAGTGGTIVGFADVENPVTTHDAFSVGSSLWAVRVTNATSSSEAIDIIRLA